MLHHNIHAVIDAEFIFNAYDSSIQPTIKSLGPTNPCHLRSIVPRKPPIKGFMGLEKAGCSFPSLLFSSLYQILPILVC